MFIFQKGNDAFAAKFFYSVLFSAPYFIRGWEAEKRIERYNRVIFTFCENNQKLGKLIAV